MYKPKTASDGADRGLYPGDFLAWYNLRPLFMSRQSTGENTRDALQC
jgi:hypothetical protein